MDQKNRLIIAIAVTLLIVAAMFTSFGRSLFSMRTEHIQLPEPGASSSSQEGAGSGSVRRAVPAGGGDPPDRPERHPHPGALQPAITGS